MKPLSILIVEDHPLQHIYLQNLLSELGDFLLETAEDGKEALERLRQRDFDLVLTDLLMPGMDGVQFIQCLASLRCKPALAIMSAGVEAHADGGQPGGEKTSMWKCLA